MFEKKVYYHDEHGYVYYHESGVDAGRQLGATTNLDVQLHMISLVTLSKIGGFAGSLALRRLLSQSVSLAIPP
jgi:hypothetical protein